MSKFPELSDEEIFDVLLCGGKPRGYGYTIQDYVDEWNDRVAVRRHIVGGTYRTLISVQNPLRLCRTGICRRLSAG